MDRISLLVLSYIEGLMRCNSKLLHSKKQIPFNPADNSDVRIIMLETHPELR